MNQLQIHQALHTLLRHFNKIASDKIAIRWLFANLLSNAREYDLYFRLQILEGALGVREGAWWTKGRAGLAEAKRAAASYNLDPDWLDSGNTGMFKIMHNLVENFVSRAKIPTTADDALQSALMGLGKNLGSIKKPAFEVGKKNSKKIQDGKETPQSIAAGVLSRWIGRKTVNEAQKEEFQELEEDTLENRPQNKRLEEESLDFFTRILFDDMHDPAGKKIREFMRKSWKGTREEEAMNLWLDLIEIGKNPKKQDIARQVGIPAQNFSNRWWPEAWKKFIQDFERNSSLIRLLDNYFAGKGFEFPKSNIADGFKHETRR